MKKELFWIEEPYVLIEKYNEIIPYTNIDINTFYNIITRILFYLIIISYFILKNFKLVIVFSIIILYIIILYYNTKKKRIDNNNKLCRDSTINNPMANPYIIGSKLDVKACDNLDQLKVIDNLRFNVYEDINRPNNTKLLERIYYTLPVTDYPNNINNFLNELYNISNKTCKSNANNCESYRDLRFIR
jgi:ABC-type bacteriocin/lantibiotic exporter with double-glycine peptidase domain